MSQGTQLAFRILAVAGWILAVLRFTPIGGEVPIEGFVLSVATGMTGTLALIGHALIRPAVEIYEAGRQIGYQQAVAERTSAKLARLDDRKLRAVRD